MNKIKVLYILHSVVMDGSSKSFFNMVVNLKNTYGIEPIVIYPRIVNNPLGLASVVPLLMGEGIKCYDCFTVTSPKLPNLSSFHLIKRYIDILFLKRISRKEICKIAVRENVCMIHTNSSVLQEGYKVAKILGIPHVWHIREYQDKDFNMSLYPSRSRFLKMLMDSYTITISKDIQKHFGLIDNNKSRVIYNPIMEVNRSIKTHMPKENYFLIANNLVEHKRPEDAIQAFAHFSASYPEYKLIIAGRSNPQYLEQLKNKCCELGVSEHVFFLGEINNVPDYMIKAKALLVSSEHEGFGRMTAEANLLGCMVIGRNSGGTKEILSATSGGFLYNDLTEFCNYMKVLAETTNDRYQEIISSAQEKARILYTTEAHVEKVYDFYKSILAL